MNRPGLALIHVRRPSMVLIRATSLEDVIWRCRGRGSVDEGIT